MSAEQKFYRDFKEAVSLRIPNCKYAVPVSGGLDSTLIVKAICELGKQHNAYFINLGGERKYVEQVEKKYGIKVDYKTFTPDETNEHIEELIRIWEEPYYALSPNYYLYKYISEQGIRVSLSGLGADELFGGYSYYDTDEYPRGLFVDIQAVSNEEKLQQDIHLLKYHHLRKNDKMGLHFNVEGRYPFLSKSLKKYHGDLRKTYIKVCLSEMGMDFLLRDKEGFRATPRRNKMYNMVMYIHQATLWKILFVK